MVLPRRSQQDNGADEYARRLRDILTARAEPDLERAVAERLRYFAYPALKLARRPVAA